MTQAKITITRTRRGLGFPDTQRYVKRAAAAALKAEGVTVPCELDVTLTDDAVIHTINREQRGVDRATDVLSFPMNELTPGAFDPNACEWDYETDRAMLGDMVISMEPLRRTGRDLRPQLRARGQLSDRALRAAPARL